MDLSVAIAEARKTFRILFAYIEKNDDKHVDNLMADYDAIIRSILTHTPRDLAEFKIKSNFILSELIDEFEDPHQIVQYCNIIKDDIAAL
jgi:hypothetical protein